MLVCVDETIYYMYITQLLVAKQCQNMANLALIWNDLCQIRNTEMFCVKQCGHGDMAYRTSQYLF